MRKAVGLLFVVAMVGGATRAQADPMRIGGYSGFGEGRHVQDAWDEGSAAAAWSQFSSELRQRVEDRNDADVRPFAPALNGHWSASGFHWDNSDHNGRDGSRFLHGLMHGRLDPEKADRLWSKMHHGWKGPKNERGPLSQETPGSVTPEPASMLLLGSGVVGLFGVRRRARQA